MYDNCPNVLCGRRPLRGGATTDTSLENPQTNSLFSTRPVREVRCKKISLEEEKDQKDVKRRGVEAFKKLRRENRNKKEDS